jgi:hypothetical protein
MPQSGVPFFFKQWGGVRKAAAGRKLDGKTYDAYPKRVQNPVSGPGQCATMAREIENSISADNFIRASELAAAPFSR